MEKKLSKIIWTVLEYQQSTPKAPAISEIQKRLLETKTSNTYCGKLYIECYNFYQQNENYFAIVAAFGYNRVFDIPTFL